MPRNPAMFGLGQLLIRISRPMKRAETMVLSIEKSSSLEEMLVAIAAAEGCLSEMVIGVLRK